MFRYNFKLATRNMLKSKTYAVINMVGLSLSVGIAFLIYFSVVYEYSYYNTISTQDEVYQIVQSWPGNEEGNYNSSYVLSTQLSEAFPEIESFTRLVNGGSNVYFTLTDIDGQRKYLGQNRFRIADQSFFDLFPFEFIHGNKELALAGLNNVVISEEIATSYFGDANPVGKILQHNDEKELIISGVVRLPKNVLEPFDILARIDLFSPGKLKKWDRDGPSYVLVNEKTNRELLKQKIAGFEIINPNTEDSSSEKVHLVPVNRVNTYWIWGRILKILSFVAIFILIIASLNYTNLSSALKIKRQNEYRLKKVMGASRSHFFHQVFADSLLVVLCSFFFSLAFIYFLSPFFNDLIGIELEPFGDALSHTLLATLIILMSCVLISDFLTHALVGLKRNFLLVARSEQKGSKSIFWNKISISFQFGLSLFLIIGSIAVIKQKDYIYKKNLGVTYENIMHYQNNSILTEKFETIETLLHQNPDVKSITLTSAHPTSVGNGYHVLRDLDLEKLKVTFKFLHVQGDFFETFNLQFVYGGQFEKNEVLNKGFVINETGMKALNFSENPIGQTIEFWGKKGPVVGVVKDFHNASLLEEIKPLIIINNKDYKGWLKQFYVKLDDNDLLKTVNFVDDQMMALLPGYPLSHTLLDNNYGKRYDQFEAFNKIFIFGAFVALFTSGVGLLSMVLFFVERRTKEIAVRKVSGAKVYQVVWLILFSFSKWILIGFPVVGFLAWLAISEGLQVFAYRTTLDWWVFGLSGLIALSIAWLTASYHTIKAASMNPVHALRNE